MEHYAIIKKKKEQGSSLWYNLEKLPRTTKPKKKCMYYAPTCVMNEKWKGELTYSHLLVCIYINYLWKDTVEISEISCLREGNHETGRQE